MTTPPPERQEAPAVGAEPGLSNMQIAFQLRHAASNIEAGLKPGGTEVGILRRAAERLYSSNPLDALRTAPAPSGEFVLVPREPTNEQICAALEWSIAWMSKHGLNGLSPFDEYPTVGQTTKGMYQAMIAAAPAPSAPAIKDVRLEPGWLARDVKRATDKVAEWEAVSAPAGDEAGKLETMTSTESGSATTGDQRAPTPGPWTNREFSTFVYSKHGNVCVCGEPRASNIVGYTECEVGSEDLGEAVANARLIAAAPDMLETLWTIVANTEPEAIQHRNYEELAAALCECARAAIAKATGSTSAVKDHQS